MKCDGLWHLPDALCADDVAITEAPAIGDALYVERVLDDLFGGAA